MSTLYPPTHCPGCGDHLRLDEDALSDGADATPCAKPHEKSFRVQHDACGWQGYVDPDDRWDRPDVDVVSELRAALTAALALAEALTQALADRDEVIRENQEQLAKFVEVCRQRNTAERSQAVAEGMVATLAQRLRDSDGDAKAAYAAAAHAEQALSAAERERDEAREALAMRDRFESELLVRPGDAERTAAHADAVAQLAAALARQRRVGEDMRELAAELREGHKALLTGEPFRPNMLGVWEGALIALAAELEAT